MMATGGNTHSTESNSVPACFFFVNAIDPSISGYRVCKYLKEAIGNTGEVKGAQILNGLYRCYVSTNEARELLLSKGVTIGHTFVPIIGVNPKIVSGTGDSVKIIIGNIPLSASNDDIQAALTKLDGVTLRSRLFFENYRDDEGGLSSFKTGRRFVYANVPPKPLPQKFQVGDWKATLYHWGQRKKTTEEQETVVQPDSRLSATIGSSTPANAPDLSTANVNKPSPPLSQVSGQTKQTRLTDKMTVPSQRSRSRVQDQSKNRTRSLSARKRPILADHPRSPLFKTSRNNINKPAASLFTPASFCSFSSVDPTVNFHE